MKSDFKFYSGIVKGDGRARILMRIRVGNFYKTLFSPFISKNGSVGELQGIGGRLRTKPFGPKRAKFPRYFENFLKENNLSIDELKFINEA